MPRELKPLDELSRSGRMYRTNPEYAAKMKANSKKHLEQARKERLKEIRNFSDEREVNGWNGRIHCGLEVFNSTAFCDYCNIARMSIYNWKKAGILPAPTMTDSMERDWYSWDYIESMRTVLKHRIRCSLDKFGAMLIVQFLKDRIIDNEGLNIECLEEIEDEVEEVEAT